MVNRTRGPLHSFETGALMRAHPLQGEAGGNARECRLVLVFAPMRESGTQDSEQMALDSLRLKKNLRTTSPASSRPSEQKARSRASSTRYGERGEPGLTPQIERHASPL